MLLITLSCTAFDLVSMLTYLAHDQEVFVAAVDIFAALTQRNTAAEGSIAGIYQAINDADDMDAPEDAASDGEVNRVNNDQEGDGESGDEKV